MEFWITVGVLYVPMLALIWAFFRGAARGDDDLPGPRPSEPDADDMEWAKQAFAEVERKESS